MKKGGVNIPISTDQPTIEVCRGMQRSRVRPMTATIKKAFDRVAAGQTVFSQEKNTNRALPNAEPLIVIKQRITGRPSTSKTIKVKTPRKTDITLAQVREEDNTSQTNRSPSGKKVVYSSHSHSLRPSARGDKEDDQLLIKEPMQVQNERLTGLLVINQDETKLSSEVSPEKTQNKFNQNDTSFEIHQMYKNRRLGQLPQDGTPLTSCFPSHHQSKTQLIKPSSRGSQKVNKRSQSSWQRLHGKIIKRKELALNHQDLFSQNGLDLCEDSPRQFVKDKRQQQHLQQRQVNYRPQTSQVSAEFQQVQPRPFHEYLCDLSQKQQITPQQSMYYNNLIQPTCGTFDHGSKKQKGFISSSNTLKELLSTGEASLERLDQPYKQAINRRFRMQRQSDTLNYNHEVDTTQQQKLSTMINQKMNQNMSLKKKLRKQNHKQQPLNYQLSIKDKLQEVQQLLAHGPSNHLSSQDYKKLVSDKLQQCESRTCSPKDIKHLNKYQHYYGSRSVQSQDLTRHWKDKIRNNEQTIKLKKYPLQSEDQLYRDMGSAILKIDAILDSDNVPSLAKRQFLSYLQTKVKSQDCQDQAVVHSADNGTTNIKFQRPK